MDVVVLNRVQNLRPVNGGEVTEFIVLFNPDRAPAYMHEAGQPDLLQMNHLKNNKGIVEKESRSTDDSEIWKKIFEAFQAVNAKEKEVVRYHGKFGKTQPFKVFALAGEHKQNLQMAFNYSAVLQLIKSRQVIPDIHTGTNFSIALSEENHKDGEHRQESGAAGSACGVIIGVPHTPHHILSHAKPSLRVLQILVLSSDDRPPKKRIRNLPYFIM